MAMQFVSAFCIYGALELESTARRTILRENFRWSHGCIWTFSRRSDWFCWSGIPPRRKQNNVSARRLESLQQDRLPGGPAQGPIPANMWKHIRVVPHTARQGLNRNRFPGSAPPVPAIRATSRKPQSPLPSWNGSASAESDTRLRNRPPPHPHPTTPPATHSFWSSSSSPPCD
mgnify:CR=1 FL=1